MIVLDDDGDDDANEATTALSTLKYDWEEKAAEAAKKQQEMEIEKTAIDSNQAP